MGLSLGEVIVIPWLQSWTISQDWSHQSHTRCSTRRRTTQQEKRQEDKDAYKNGDPTNSHLFITFLTLSLKYTHTDQLIHSTEGTCPLSVITLSRSMILINSRTPTGTCRVCPFHPICAPNIEMTRIYISLKMQHLYQEDRSSPYILQN
jgi:hypothetical protein